MNYVLLHCRENRFVEKNGGRNMHDEINLRNMTGIYISRGAEMLMLYRIGSRVVEPSWCGIGGHFEDHELNNPRICVLRELEEEIGLKMCIRDRSKSQITMRTAESNISTASKSRSWRHCWYAESFC